MGRVWLGGICAVFLVGRVQAHFLFLVPGDPPKTAVQVVFGDSLKPDTMDLSESVREGGKFWTDTADGQSRPVKIVGGEQGWTLEGSEGVYGTRGMIEYGVVLRGQDEPFLIVYHASSFRSPLPKASGQKDSPLEIEPVSRPGGFAFAVLVKGKPGASADVVVEVPGEKRPRTVKTDASGLTPVFEAPGTYSARSSRLEDRAGECRGKSYKQVRHYATLVVRHEAATQP